MGGLYSLRLCKIGALRIDDKKGNHGMKGAAPLTLGYREIIKEISRTEPVEETTIENAGQYDILLLSITSPIEIEKILALGYEKPKGQKVIAGGMCALNPWPLYDLVDVMVFGRAEGIGAVALSDKSMPYIWRKEEDPGVEGRYEIRQMARALDGERAIGCPNKCLYCQYTWIRQCTAIDGYDPGMTRPEDDWNRVEVSGPGRYVTAIDGLSQSTRNRVHKPVSDEQIISKIRSIQERDLPSAVVMKVFQIIGFPWETPESVLRDLAGFRDLMVRADSGCGGRVVLMLLFTPFSPEPMTPMEGEAVIARNWRPVIEASGRAVYWSDHLEVFILPQIQLAETLARRILINRCGRQEYKSLNQSLSNPRLVFSDWPGYSHLQSPYLSFNRAKAGATRRLTP